MFKRTTTRRGSIAVSLSMLLAALLLSTSALAGSGSSPGGSPSADIAPAQKVAGTPGAGKPIPGQYIVTLKEGENPRAVAAIVGADPKWVYENALDGFTAELNNGQLNALRHNKAVAAIEQDQEITPTGYVTEYTDSGNQPWGLDRVDQRTGLSHSYSYWSSGTYGAGYGVRAYVIDSGISTSNSDFGGRAQMVYDAFSGNGQDCFGHGTHVAGTIGGTRYGIAKSVTLLGVRVMGCDGNFPNGNLGAAIAGVDWVRMHAIKPAVANISWHAGGVSTALNTAVTNLVNSGVFVSVAAANDSRDACNDSPGSAAGTITVAASDYTDTRASFSNYGPCVDLYAPGVTILSTYLNGGTTTMNGTSMASPHVAGVAALLLSDYGYQTPSTIASWILTAATQNAIKGNITGTPNRLLYMSGW